MEYRSARFILTLALGSSVPFHQANAELLGRSLTGTGVDSDPNTYEAYYDPLTNLLWLTDANLLLTQYAADHTVIDAIVATTPTIPDQAYAGVDAAGNSDSDTSYHVTAGDPAHGTAGDFYDPSTDAFDGRVTWYGAKAWVNWLNSRTFGGISDWRLPSVTPQNGKLFRLGGALDGTTDDGYRITSAHSEMSRLFYVDLRLLAANNASGQPSVSGNPINNFYFENLSANLYWYGSNSLPGGTAWSFQLATGEQIAGKKKPATYAYPWPVRTGDIGSASTPVSEQGPLNTQPLVTVPFSNKTARIDVRPNSNAKPWNIDVSALDIDGNSISLKLLDHSPGVTISPSPGKGSASASISIAWMPRGILQGYFSQFTVQAAETDKSDHPTGATTLLKSAPKTVYLRVFPPEGSSLVRDVKITSAIWTPKSLKLRLKGTVTPLPILTREETETLYRSSNVQLYSTDKIGNELIKTSPIEVHDGKWQTEIVFESASYVPCLLYANFAGANSSYANFQNLVRPPKSCSTYY